MKLPLIILSVMGLALSGTAAGAAVEVLATCKLGDGNTYYAKSSLMERGWKSDGFGASGQIILLLNENKFDIVMKDATGTHSVADNDGKIIDGKRDGTAFLITVAYPKASETFVFDIQAGIGQLYWTSARVSKTGLLGTKVGAYVGVCGS